MEILAANASMARELGPLVAEFRVTLRALKGITSTPNVPAGEEELREYLDAGFPVFALREEDAYVGYMVCRVEAPCVWVESIFVSPAYRRKGAASALLKKAEALAESYGEETLYFNVHPNNHRMIGFLQAHGYTALNLIEIRKPYKGESLDTKLRVGDHEFHYSC